MPPAIRTPRDAREEAPKAPNGPSHARRLVFVCAFLLLAGSAPAQNTIPEGPAVKPTPRRGGFRPVKLSLSADVESVSLCEGRPKVVTLTAVPLNMSDREVANATWAADGGNVKPARLTAVWDLSGVRPGRYTATVSVPRTSLAADLPPFKGAASVVVEGCCPSMKIHCPAGVSAGERFDASVEWKGGTPSITPTFKWRMREGGATTERTGGPQIRLQTGRTNVGRVDLEVFLGGYGTTCVDECVIPVRPTPTPSPTPTATPTPSPSPVAGVVTPSPEPSQTPAPTAPTDGFSVGLRSLIIPAALVAAALALLLAMQYFGGARHLGEGGVADAVVDDRPEESSAGAVAAGGAAVIGQEEESDEVHCTVFAPLQASPGDGLLVQVFAHLAAQVPLLADIAKDADADARRRDSIELDEPVGHGEELVFELTMDGLDVREPTLMRLVWKGKPKSVKFDVRVPDDFACKDVTGTVEVYRLNVPVGALRFKLKVVPRALAAALPAETIPEQKFTRYKYAFISYASEDRAEVLRRVQLLPLVEIDYFQDVTSLDPGDRWAQELYKEIDKSDVFFLFWSEAARDSEWVNREVLYALEHRHGDDGCAPVIKPVLLKGPPPVPPPESLRSLHFNDKIMYFISVEDALRAKRTGGTPPADKVS
jgi:hypothetical protein